MLVESCSFISIEVLPVRKQHYDEQSVNKALWGIDPNDVRAYGPAKNSRQVVWGYYD